MKRLIFFGASALCLLTLSVFEIQACTCAQSRSPAHAFAASAAVFVGTVKDILVPAVNKHDSNDSSRAKVVFNVQEPLKGVTEKEVTLLQGGGGDCIYSFEKGETYLAYASASDAGYYAFLCGGTTPAEVGS